MARTLEIKTKCFECLTNFSLMVDPVDRGRMQLGVHIQDAMPYLTAGERELIISNTCEKCFDTMMAEVTDDC